MKRLVCGILLALLVCADAFSYSNCEFQNKRHTTVCEKAVAKGVSYDYANAFLLSFKSTRRDLKSLKLFSPEKIETLGRYEKRANNSLVQYIPDLVRHLKRYRKVYDAAEREYGVNREIVAAILLKETHLGKIRPKHDAFIVFNTLATELKDDSKRNRRLIDMATENLAELMRYCYQKGIKPGECSFRSSYAGAVGIPQFMPQSFRYIESFEGGIGDLWKMEDAILSASRYLHEHAGFTTPIEWGDVPPMEKIESAWYDYDAVHEGVTFADTGRDKDAQCFSCKEPGLDVVRMAVKRIMRYNHSSNYAVGVMRLAYEAHRAMGDD